MKRGLIIIIFSLSFFLSSYHVYAGIVLSSHKYAWSDNVGYINFENVTVNDTILSGYAWSANKGFIKFNPAQGGVFNDGNGNLSGSAWGENLGWIDFDNVAINPSNGEFSGTANGPLSGTINFDCPNFCDVQTNWRPTSSSSSSNTSNNISGGGAPGRIFPTTTTPISNLNNDVVSSLPEIIPKKSPMIISKTTKPEQSFLSVRNVSQAASPVTASSALFDVVSEPSKVKVAPGELLPIPVKLSNFGGNKRVDVLIKYSILNSAGQEIYNSDETMAVETTASFIKTVQIPLDTGAGTYTAKTSITYKGQLVPATTEFPFVVEPKILGLFQSLFFLYGSVTIVVSILMILLGYALVKRHRRARFTAFDYSNVPHNQRIFYEILSDTIAQMRQRVGDDALLIASKTEGLKIDVETGRVLALNSPPAKIIADLVSEYEKLLGKKVSFLFRKEK